jgi:hypothetical protein
VLIEQLGEELPPGVTMAIIHDVPPAATSS